MEENERAYWTNEVAYMLEIGDSTLRKWSIALEKQGYHFVKGDQESRAFLKNDIDVLLRMKNAIRLERRSTVAAAKIAIEQVRMTTVQVDQQEDERDRTTLVPVEQDITTPVPSNNQFDYESISKMIVQEVSSLWVKKMEESEKRHEEREAFLLKKFEEHEERHLFLENEIQDIKEEQKASRKLVESQLMNDELKKAYEKTDQLFEQIMKEIATSKEKKGFFKRLFGR